MREADKLKKKLARLSELCVLACLFVAFATDANGLSTMATGNIRKDVSLKVLSA